MESIKFEFSADSSDARVRELEQPAGAEVGMVWGLARLLGRFESARTARPHLSDPNTTDSCSIAVITVHRLPWQSQFPCLCSMGKKALRSTQPQARPVLHGGCWHAFCVSSAKSSVTANSHAQTAPGPGRSACPHRSCHASGAAGIQSESSWNVFATTSACFDRITSRSSLCIKRISLRAREDLPATCIWNGQGTR